MVEPAASTASTTPAAPSFAVPPAMFRDKPARVVWRAGEEIHRIHPNRFGAEEFNPRYGDARFSPIQSSAGIDIPTLYGGSTFECAAMETIFHEVPYEAGFKEVKKTALADKHYSVLVPKTNLELVDLRNVALRKLGIQRTQLIDTYSSHYPLTRAWAIALHAADPAAQGLMWISRQDDSARALVLFEDRIPADMLTVAHTPLDIIADVRIYSSILDLAVKIGASII